MVSLGLATQGTQGDVVELADRRLYRCLRPRQLEGFCGKGLCFARPNPRDVSFVLFIYIMVLWFSHDLFCFLSHAIHLVSDQDEPTFVDALRGVGVSQIACGSGHTVVLTTDGQVYTWGRGDDGRLGHGDNGWKYVPRIAQSLSGQVIVQVTCGSYHTAAVASNGDLFTWGGGMYGKLGHGNESGHSTPRRVEGLVGLTVSQIACGSRHTAVLTSTGALYTWGDKENGVAGHGDTEGHQYTPKLLERMAGKRVIQLSACGFHTGCLTDSHEVYTVSECAP